MKTQNQKGIGNSFIQELKNSTLTNLDNMLFNIRNNNDDIFLDYLAQDTIPDDYDVISILQGTNDI